MILNKVISAIFINMLTIYIISKYISWLGFHISFSSWALEVYLIVWAIFWFLYMVLKKIVKLLTLPLNIITLWIIWIIINILFIYLFQYVMNNYLAMVAKVQLGSVFQVFILSILIYLLNLLFKKL